VEILGVRELKLGIALAGICMVFLMFAVAAEDVAVTLELDFDGDRAADGSVEKTMAEGSSALDLLNETVDVTFGWMDWGAFVVEINGVRANWEEEETWWMFLVNGEMAEVSVDKYVLQDSDVVTMSMAGAEEAEAHIAATS
jgi:hypothetical protein